VSESGVEPRSSAERASTRRSKSRRLNKPNGAGSVVKRKEAWYTVRDPETGESLRKYLFGKTEQEARALLIEALEARWKGFTDH
jgi:hypothetical protein